MCVLGTASEKKKKQSWRCQNDDEFVLGREDELRAQKGKKFVVIVTDQLSKQLV